MDTVVNETARSIQPNGRGFPWGKALLALAVLVVLWMAIVPHLGSYGGELLVEGIVLWRGEPVDANVHAYPLLRDGTFGERTMVQHPSGVDQTGFAIISGRNWRRRYPAPNDVVITVRVFPGHLSECSPEDSERILLYDDPATSPYRMTVGRNRLDFVRIDLSTGRIEHSDKPKGRPDR